MKRLLIGLFLFSSKSVFTQSNIDVLHYKFNIGLNDVNDTVYGLAIISFTATEKTNSFSLDLTTKLKDGKGMHVVSASFIDPKLKSSQAFYENDRISFKGITLIKGDTTSLIINYKGIPSDGLIISKNKYGRRTFFADHWPNRAHQWLPCKDDPADKASVEFIVTAPEHYQVVANGIQVEESSLNNGFKKTHWKEDVPVPTKVMTLGVADFAVNLAGTINGCIPVTSWVFPEDRDKGFYDLEIAKDILPWFIEYIGPYGYKKLANVQSKTIFGGLENANTIFYSQNIATGDRSREGTVAHEIAHQWFGNMATEKSFAHLWLSEGFATYFTTLYFENKSGAAKAKELREEDRQQIIAFSKEDKTPVVNTAETDYMNLLNANNYQKGGWVLHMLRMQVGDSVFKKIIRKYYSTYAGKNADSGDFQKIAEQVSGKDLRLFFKQWLYTAGQPKLDIKWKYNDKEKNITLTIRQQQSIAFSFPIEIAYTDDKGLKSKTFSVSKSMEVFKIPVAKKPSKMEADPDCDLLFEGNISEMK
jgi:aminopeptidase N